MASPMPPVNPDSLIAIKVNHLGVTKRVKLPLRDLAASSLEDKLRSILGITSSSGYRFERYSDSAGVFVLLDRNNPSVYRQLYRAAKAKQKLKLRVAAHVPAPQTDAPGPDQTQRTFESAAVPANDAQPLFPVPVPVDQKLKKPKGPRPVTLEDVIEPTPAESAPLAAQEQATVTPASTLARPSASPLVVSSDMSRRDYPAVPGCFPTPAAAAAAAATIAPYSSPVHHWGVEDEGKLQATLDNAARNHEELERTIARLTLSVAEMGRKSLEAGDHASSSSTTETTPSTEMEKIPAQCTMVPEKQSLVDYFAVGLAPAADAPESARPVPVVGFSIRCNSCDRKIANTHYHCSTCEAGDFDLCKECVDLGIACYNPDHWLISRSIKDGIIVNSTTERISPKPKTTTTTKEPAPAERETGLGDADVKHAHDHPLVPMSCIRSLTTGQHRKITLETLPHHQATRTCNNCITELPEKSFLHCKVCPDFDLCSACFRNDKHGHHPAHAFAPAVKNTQFDTYITRRLPAGRGEIHNAVCDSCNNFITGTRHKCLDCPDWDYCSTCMQNANTEHPLHRFVTLNEPLPLEICSAPVVHRGIYCDGPLCATKRYTPIRGVRYKCAVCDDVDFCANCEASPSNTHSETHPLIKLRTPVSRVGVTTIHREEDGTNMRVLGDRGYSRPTEVRTVVDTVPTAGKEEPATIEKKPVQEAKSATAATVNKAPAEPDAAQLGATFQSEAVSDGTVFPPNHVFEQTWVLRNTGSVAWPAGCCVRFVSGDYMGHVDRNHPAGIGELVSASESTICYAPLAPGAEFSFTVLLRTSPRLGKTISYWRLSTKEGIKFGDRLWCQVDVRLKEEETKDSSSTETKDKGKVTEEASVSADNAEPTEASQMIFPKLWKESPVASIHEPEASSDRDEQDRASQTSHASQASPKYDAVQGTYEFDDDEWDDDSFLTDEEYDVLDASDEEFLEEQQAKDQKK